MFLVILDESESEFWQLLTVDDDGTVSTAGKMLSELEGLYNWVTIFPAMCSWNSKPRK